MGKLLGGHHLATGLLVKPRGARRAGCKVSLAERRAQSCASASQTSSLKLALIQHRRDRATRKAQWAKPFGDSLTTQLTRTPKQDIANGFE